MVRSVRSLETVNHKIPKWYPKNCASVKTLVKINAYLSAYYQNVNEMRSKLHDMTTVYIHV